MMTPCTGQLPLADPEPAGQPIRSARASDADRERAVDALSKAFAEGRLTAEEHDTRVERAYGARTYAELSAVSADLPAGPVATLPAPARGGPVAGISAQAGRRTNSLAVAALVCSVIPGLPQLAAIILGIGALRQIRRTGERGMVLAGAALALATLGPVLAVLLILL